MSRPLDTSPAAERDRQARRAARDAGRGPFAMRCACWRLLGWLRYPERPEVAMGVRVDVGEGGLWLVAHGIADPRACLPRPVLYAGAADRAAAVDHLTAWAREARALLCWGPETQPPAVAWRPPAQDVPELRRGDVGVPRGELRRIGAAGLPLLARRRASGGAL